MSNPTKAAQLEKIDHEDHLVETVDTFSVDQMRSHPNDSVKQDEVTIDSGFISGQQLPVGSLDCSDGRVKEAPSPLEENYDESQDKTLTNQQIFDSGCIEEMVDETNDLNSKNANCHSTDTKKKTAIDVIGNQRNGAPSDSHGNERLQNATNDLNNHNLNSNNTNESLIQPKTNSTISHKSWEKYYQQNEEGNTLLHLACISGKADFVNTVIRMAPHPCLLNIQNDEAETPLHMAAIGSHPNILRMLIIAGAEFTMRDCNGNTALHLACLNGDEKCVRALIEPIKAEEIQNASKSMEDLLISSTLLPINLETINYEGERCVHVAAEEGFIDIMQILVSRGADINAREGKAGRTPLHIAIEKANMSLINFLLNKCENINIETSTYAQLTAYQIAHILNKAPVLALLEKHGAKILLPPESDNESSDTDSESESY